MVSKFQQYQQNEHLSSLTFILWTKNNHDIYMTLEIKVLACLFFLHNTFFTNSTLKRR